MAPTDTIRHRIRTRVLVWSDVLAYVLVVAAFFTLLAVVVGIVTGGGLVRAKVLLFLGGVGLMAYATARLWPESPATRDGRRNSASVDPDLTARDRTRFQRFVDALSLGLASGLPPHERATTPGKLFWSSVAMLLVSYLMETVFGVA